VVAAILVKTGLAVERYWRLKSHHSTAQRGYETAARWFSEGRIGVVRGVLASRRLMEAKLALFAKDEAQLSDHDG
jgi:hypothetical protein